MIVDKTFEAFIIFIATVVCTSQIFMPCYYGNIATTLSDEFITNLYSCPWYEMPLEARKMIIIIMENSQKTMSFGIAEIFRLNIEQFGRVSR